MESIIPIFSFEQTNAENIRSFVGGLEILVNLLKSENLEVRSIHFWEGLIVEKH